jgi:hypothetical protein
VAAESDGVGPSRWWWIDTRAARIQLAAADRDQGCADHRRREFEETGGEVSRVASVGDKVDASRSGPCCHYDSTGYGRHMESVAATMAAWVDGVVNGSRSGWRGTSRSAIAGHSRGSRLTRSAATEIGKGAALGGDRHGWSPRGRARWPSRGAGGARAGRPAARGRQRRGRWQRKMSLGSQTLISWYHVERVKLV